jgi:hypothetical protein
MTRALPQSPIEQALDSELDRIAAVSCGRSDEHGKSVSWDPYSLSWKGWAGWGVRLSRRVEQTSEWEKSAEWDTSEWACVCVSGCESEERAYACLLGAVVDEHERQRDKSGLRLIATADTWPSLTPVCL